MIFSNIFLTLNDFLNKPSNLSACLFENNKETFKQVYQFLKSNENLLLVNGPHGCGKTTIINHALAMLSPDVIVLKHNCFEANILDDVFLSFFKEFKKLQSQGIITEPRIKTENFIQKINACFSTIEKPFLVVFNSFDTLLEDNRKEILDFINHISSFDKIKFIIISKEFDTQQIVQTLVTKQILVKEFSKDLTEKHLKLNKIKYHHQSLEDFHKHTKGNPSYIDLVLKILNKHKITLDTFLAQLQGSFIPLTLYLQRQIIELAPTNTRNLLWFITLMRHDVSMELLKTLKFYDEGKIQALIDLSLFNDDNIYVNNLFKIHIEETMPIGIKQKLHEYIISLYETQLPLKPFERNILISRQTMRNEIEYHKIFAPIGFKKKERSILDANYLSYTNKVEFKDEKVNKEEKTENIDKAEKEELPQDSLNALDYLKMKHSDMAPLTKRDLAIMAQGDVVTEVTLRDLLELAKKLEANYSFKEVVETYLKALDLDPQELAPAIYEKLANAYTQLSDSENALKYYNLAKHFYGQDEEARDSISLKIAKILYETYQNDKAQEVLVQIIGCQSKLINIKAHLALATLNDNPIEYYKKAVELVDGTIESDVLSELYFKYALVLDDTDDVKSAVQYYQKCIEVNYSLNNFMSSSYFNLGTLCAENGEKTEAIEFFEKAFKLDEKNKNTDGIYIAAAKLAQIYQRRDPKKALHYFTIAYDCAIKLNDIFNIATSSLAIGDFHYELNQNEDALKYYLSTMNLVKDEFSKENLDKIQVRINDIKFRIGQDRFDILERKMNGTN